LPDRCGVGVETSSLAGYSSSAVSAKSHDLLRISKKSYKENITKTLQGIVILVFYIYIYIYIYM
jgi:hypothetical protein